MSGCFKVKSLPAITLLLAVVWSVSAQPANRLTLNDSLAVYSTVPATPPTLTGQFFNGNTMVIAPDNGAAFFRLRSP